MLHWLHAPDRLRPWAQRVAAWLLVLLCLATLAPGISRSLAASATPATGSSPHWVEVCSSEGLQWVSTGATTASTAIQTHTDADVLDRCGHCTLASERFAPLIPCWSLSVYSPLPNSPPLVDSGTKTSQAALAPSARDPPLLT